MFASYRTLFFFCLIICFREAPAQTDQRIPTLDSLVGSQFTGNIPGMSICIAEKGKIIYEKAFGSANIELSTPMQPGMVFRIGSITKQFTAVGVLQLVEQGKISLADPIGRYLPDLPDYGNTVTIENLLTHTSGIVEYTSIESPDPYSERRDWTPGQLIAYFKDKPLTFGPGTKYSYSNSNYALLGYLIEKVSGQPYHQYMEDHVLRPAGLTHTFYAGENVIIPGRVEGYTRDKGYYENTEYQSISIGYGAGDLLSTVEDLYLWNKAVLDGILIRKETVEKAFSPYRLKDGTLSQYGYGWFIDSLQGRKCIHHEGQVSGFIAEEKYFPDQDLYVSICTNVKSGEDTTDFSTNRFQLMDNIALVAAGIALPRGITLSQAELDSYVGLYRSIDKHSGTIRIYKEQGKLYADLSNKTGLHMVLLPLTATTFLLPSVRRIRTTVEFIKENGVTVKGIWTQEKKYGFERVQNP
ncbi:MAG TPA: serine hydrolase domain-containing protein [Puia sp.]|jgi:CubicO group peptidase (beta-lactamase class C family)|nr:serine hydrolase domain-containing protein [Puia sp.]